MRGSEPWISLGSSMEIRNTMCTNFSWGLGNTVPLLPIDRRTFNSETFHGYVLPK